MASMSLEEQMRIKALKEQKRDPWSAAAWEEASRRNHESQPPRMHLIILQAPFSAPALIKQVVGLPETPSVEQTHTIPDGKVKDGKGETISSCRLDDIGYSAICEWLGRNPNYFLQP